MEKLARALLIVFSGSQGTSEYHKDDDKSLTLKKLYLGDNDFGDLGLVALARALSLLPRCRETLEELKVDVNKHLTTLAPLADAGVLKGLKHLWAGKCSLSGDEGVLPPELCANLPALEYLNLCWNEGLCRRAARDAGQARTSLIGLSLPNQSTPPQRSFWRSFERGGGFTEKHFSWRLEDGFCRQTRKCP